MRILRFGILLLCLATPAAAQQWPGQCPAGVAPTSIGCQPEAVPPADTDLVAGWQVGQAPKTRAVQVGQIRGTSSSPVTGWFKGISVSDLLSHVATVRLEFPTFASFSAYVPSVYVTAINWIGAPVVAHTSGYYAAGDGGGATYIWDSTSAVTADGLYYITPAGGSSGRWVLEVAPGGASALQLGVIMDGITPTDVKLAAALAACSTYGTKLNFPGGQILLNGAATSTLQDCAVQGIGVPGGLLGSPASYGTMFLLTSTSTKPFNIGSNWSASDINFFWPNQTTGTQFYPPLFSPATETATTSDWYLDHVNIINAYDGIVTGGGRFNVTDSNIYAMRDAFRVGNIGDSFRLTGIHFTPGPWFTMTNNTAPYTNASSTNVMLHAQDGGNNTINFSAANIGAFAWGTAIKIDAGVTVGETEFDGLFDTIQTMIDASASGAVWAGYSQTPIRGSAGCFSTCFKLGATGTLFIDGWTGGSSKTFVESAGASVYLSNVFAPGVGSIADGNDYYFVHLTANPGGGAVISLRNNSTTGVPASIKVHGLTTDVAAARLIIQNSDFSFFNDVINAQSASTTVIQGNWSIGTQGSQSLIASSLATGGHGISYSNNVWDKPPQATITAGFGTGPTIQGGFSGVIFAGTGSTTGGSFQLPFVPIGPAGGSCNFTPSIGSNISASVSGSPPTWNILSENNLAGGQLFYNCGGVAQQ